MSRVAGFTVLVLGLGFGGYVYYPELAQYDADARNAAERLVNEEKARAEAVIVPASTPRDARTFSPQSPLFAPVVPPAPVKASRPQPVAAPVATAPAAPSPVVQSKVEPAAPTERKPATGEAVAWAATVVPAASESSVPKMSSRPRDEGSRERLARELQHELKRVGCYDGEVDGQWGGGSRRAMTAFTERVNATLPVEEPDYILLTLVQGHRGAACGKACPAGQVLSNDRCLPHSVVAQAERKARRTAPPAAVAAKAPAAEPVRGAPPPAITRTAEAQPEPAREPRRGEDLPGRMSIGGPVVPVPVLKSEPRRATLPPSRMAEARPETGTAPAGVVPATPLPETGGAAAVPVPPSAARDAAKVERHSRPAKAHEPRAVRHAPEPRYVQRPQFTSKSKRMIYDLFQRPDRIN